MGGALLWEGLGHQKWLDGHPGTHPRLVADDFGSMFRLFFGIVFVLFCFVVAVLFVLLLVVLVCFIFQ